MNPRDFRPSESVTPLKRRAQDGIVYERTGEKRQPEPGELHWCDATRPAPYPFRWPKRTRFSRADFWAQPEGVDKSAWPCKHCGLPKEKHEGRNCPRFHKCPIWIVSADQEWQPPVIQSGAQNEIDRLIQEVEIVRETGSDYGRLIALGSLHQAKELERIANTLDSLCTVRFIPEGSRGIGSREVQTCVPCQHGEHSGCTDGMTAGIHTSHCGCDTCHANPGPIFFHPVRHRFEGMEDNHFCTKCGGGRLHGIHQV